MEDCGADVARQLLLAVDLPHIPDLKLQQHLFDNLVEAACCISKLFVDHFPSFHVLDTRAMKHIRDLMSVAQALRQTFITPIKLSPVGFLQPHTSRSVLQSRLFHESRRLARQDNRQPVQGPIKDEGIRAPFVQTVNEQGDIEMPARLLDVLESFDRSKFFLLQVSAGEPGKPPVCKITNKLAYAQREKEKVKAAKASKSQTKQIELNWAIDAHDLEYRLKQLTSFLEKGRKVEVTLTRKRRKRAPTVEEIKQVIQSVVDTTREAGGSQVKAMEGEAGKELKITVRK